MTTSTPKRFATKEAAEAYKTSYWLGYTAIWIHDNYAAVSGVPCGGWYLWSRKAPQEFASDMTTDQAKMFAQTICLAIVEMGKSGGFDFATLVEYSEKLSEAYVRCNEVAGQAALMLAGDCIDSAMEACL